MKDAMSSAGILLVSLNNLYALKIVGTIKICGLESKRLCKKVEPAGPNVIKKTFPALSNLSENSFILLSFIVNQPRYSSISLWAIIEAVSISSLFSITKSGSFGNSTSRLTPARLSIAPKSAFL